MAADPAVGPSLRISVAYALPARQMVVELEVEPGCTVREAIERSGLLTEFPDLTVDPARVGIFSRKVAMDQQLLDGDRVEIYRPLLADPKESRRQRAARE